MIVSTFSWLVALLISALPSRQRGIAFWPMAFVVGILSVLALWITYQPPTTVVLNYDRAVYESAFLELQSSDSFSDYEVGYAILQAAAVFIGLDPPSFFVLLCMFFLTSLWVFLRSRYGVAEALLLMFLSLNFFPFMQGALNVTRQFVAASVLLFAFPFFARALESNFKHHSSSIGLVGVVLVASLFHQSAALCLIPFALVWLGLRVPQLAVLSVALFAANALGFGAPLWGPLVGSSAKLSEYVWSFDHGSVGIAYAGGVNRIDFFVFSILPILSHAVVRMRVRNELPSRDAMILFYLCLVFPLFALSFLPYSDRLALYGWLVWPVAFADLAMRSDSDLSLGVRVLCTIAFGAIALFGLYGLTATGFAFELLF